MHWLEWLRTFRYWNISRDAAIQVGLYRLRYARLGRKFRTPDALIAAVAAQYGAILLTVNVKGFPMPEVTVLSLRA